MTRRRSGSIVANPVLVGAVTTLVVVVAVFLSYNANSGLPFVPTRSLKIDVASGANVVPGNEVREGGQRIGVVSDMRPTRLPSGVVGARLELKIDNKIPAIPVDSTVNLRPRSVLGLKYVELTRGRSRDTFADGDTLPPDQARYPVTIDEFYSQYDERTRAGVRRNLRGFGDALQGRGASINDTLGRAPSFLRHLEPVARTLADRDTRLGRFFRELGDAARVVSPVSNRYAHSFTAGADTFEAWSRYPSRLQGTLERSAPTMRTALRSFPEQRRFLADLRDFSAALDRTTATFPSTLPRITRALRTGIPVVRKQPPVNERLATVFASLERLSSAPPTAVALRGLTRTTAILNPLLRFVGPYITVCNYFNSAWSNTGEHLTEPDPTGYAQRTLLNQASRPANPTDPSLGSIGARRPVNGEPTISGSPMAYHNSPYSAAVGADGSADCEAGQRGYLEKLTTYDHDPSHKWVTDPHIPGNQGPTYTGLSRVPAGETFTRSPQTGPQMPKELDAP
jgi:ABC-type transporter Mla subunit MlaD